MSRDPSGKRYHHGDLHRALLDAAESLMAEQAGWTFTLREVARAAGVSHNAPYNHFADRRALLAAVAARGFDELAAALARALDGTDEADAATGLRATAQAYLTFALASPARYRLMFSTDLSDSADPVLRAAGARASGVLAGIVTRGVAAGRLRPDPGGTHALAAWSIVHGLGTLLLDGKVPRPVDDRHLAALAERVATSLVHGLATPEG